MIASDANTTGSASPRITFARETTVVSDVTFAS
jgi:hypothetical protein